MKIQTPALLKFEPRRLSSEGTGTEDQQQQLRLENPTFSRSVDIGQIAHGAASSWNALKTSKLGRAGAGAVSLGAGIWGLNKLAQGKTFLDRVEGVGLLAMSMDRAVDASGNQHPAASTGAGLVQCGADLILGGADTIRGIREKDRRRLTVGLCQSAIGACIGTSALFPSVSGAATAVLCVAGVTKQLAIGFHFGLPD